MEEPNILVEKLLGEARNVAKIENSLIGQKRERGELFNVFNILGVDTAEIVHSKFIACLLDPKGLHGCHDLFIKISPFVSMINEPIVSVSVETEKSIGNVSEDYSKGGRMDLFLKVKTEKGDYAICVENKVYAEDQPNQLLRYQDYLKREYPNKWFLYYLTLDGREITQDKNVDYIPISYRNEISKWIKGCISIAAEKPLIREMLVQYFSTINQISNNGGDEMSENLLEILKENKGYIDALKKLEAVEPKLKESIFNDFFEFLNKESSLSFEKGSDDMSQKYSTFFYEKPEWRKIDLQVGFMFEYRNYGGLFYGIAKKDEKSIIPEELKTRCHDDGYLSTDWWAGWRWMEDPFINWDLSTFSLLNEKEGKKRLATSIIEKTKKLEHIIDDYLIKVNNAG